jgi:hypothetical protein
MTAKTFENQIRTLMKKQQPPTTKTSAAAAFFFFASKSTRCCQRITQSQQISGREPTPKTTSSEDLL